MQGGLNAKTLFICSVSYFSLGGLGDLYGRSKPTKSPRGDGTVDVVEWLVSISMCLLHEWSSAGPD